jgi:hypothetical protein
MHAVITDHTKADMIRRRSGLVGAAAKGSIHPSILLGKVMLFSDTVSDCVVVRLAAIAGLALSLAGCAARQVTPISMTQPTDDRLTCSEIDQEMKSNQAAAAELLQRNKEVDQANAAKVVASVMLSGWFALTVDLSNEEQIKMRALADRNEALGSLKIRKKCAT